MRKKQLVFATIPLVFILLAGAFAAPRLPILLFGLRSESITKDVMEANKEMADFSKVWTKRVLALDPEKSSDQQKFMDLMETARGRLNEALMKHGYFSSELERMSAPPDAVRFRKSLLSFSDYYTGSLLRAKKLCLYSKEMVRLARDMERRSRPSDDQPITIIQAMGMIRKARNLVVKANSEIAELDMPAELNEQHKAGIADLAELASLLDELLTALKQADQARAAALEPRFWSLSDRLKERSDDMGEQVQSNLFGVRELKVLRRVQKETAKLENKYGLFWLPGKIKIRLPKDQRASNIKTSKAENR